MFYCMVLFLSRVGGGSWGAGKEFYKLRASVNYHRQDTS